MNYKQTTQTQKTVRSAKRRTHFTKPQRTRLLRGVLLFFVLASFPLSGVFANSATPVVNTTITVAKTGSEPFDGATWDGADLGTAGLDADEDNNVVRMQDSITYKIEVSVNDNDVDELISTVELDTKQSWIELPNACKIDPTEVTTISSISADGRTLVCNLGPAIEGTARTFYPASRALAISTDGNDVTLNDDRVSATASAQADGVSNVATDGPTDVVVTANFAVNTFKELKVTAYDDEGNPLYKAPAKKGEDGTTNGSVMEYVIKIQYQNGSMLVDAPDEVNGDFEIDIDLLDHYSDDNIHNDTTVIDGTATPLSSGAVLYDWDPDKPACELIGDHGPNAAVNCSQINHLIDQLSATFDGNGVSTSDGLNDPNIEIALENIDVRDPDADTYLVEMAINIWFSQPYDIASHQNCNDGPDPDPICTDFTINSVGVYDGGSGTVVGYNPVSTEDANGTNLLNYNGTGEPQPEYVTYPLVYTTPGSWSHFKNFYGTPWGDNTKAPDQSMAEGQTIPMMLNIFDYRKADGGRSQICDKLDTTVFEFVGLAGPNVTNLGYGFNQNIPHNPNKVIWGGANPLTHNETTSDDVIILYSTTPSFTTARTTDEAQYLTEIRAATCDDDVNGDGTYVLDGLEMPGGTPSALPSDWVTDPTALPGGAADVTRIRVETIYRTDANIAIDPTHNNFSIATNFLIKAKIGAVPYGPNDYLPNYSVNRRDSLETGDPNWNAWAGTTSGGVDPLGIDFGYQALTADRMILIPSAMSIEKYTEPRGLKVVRGGDMMDFIIEPTLFGGWAPDITTATIDDPLPAGTDYVLGSERFSLDNGTTWLTYDDFVATATDITITTSANSNPRRLDWDFGDLQTGDQLPLIRYTVLVDPELTSGTFVNTAVLNSDLGADNNGDDAADPQSARYQLSMFADTGLDVLKTVDYPIYEVNEAFTYNLTYKNLGGEDYSGAEFIDILPYNDDGTGQFSSGLASTRVPSSTYNGTFEVTSITANNGETVYATNVDPTTIEQDPCHASNLAATYVPVAGELCYLTYLENSNAFPGGGAAGTGTTPWTACTALAPLTCGALTAEEITGIRFSAPSVLADDGGHTLELELTPLGNVGGTPDLDTNGKVTAASTGDVYTNNFGGRVSEISLLVISNDVSVTMVNGSIGDRVWYDANEDQAQDGEDGIEGVTVRLLDADGDPIYVDPVTGGIVDDSTPDAIPYTAVTDANGNYTFDNLPSGDYQVVVDDTTLPVGMEQTYDASGGLDHTSAYSLPQETNSAGQLIGVEDNVAQDFGYVERPVFDLALRKELANAGPFVPGGPATFTITVFNQGNVDATDIVITDHAPAGLSYASSNAATVTTTADANAVVVTDNGDLTFAIDALAEGDSVAIDVTMTLAADATGNLTNYAEISSADDDGDAGTAAPTDVDSTPDSENQNTDGEDANLVDDEIDADGLNGGDEDDHDPATLSVTIFDLALTKTLSSTGPFVPGDPATFTITVFNQGNVAATDIVVTDHAPAGLSYASSNAATVTTTTNAAAVVVTDNGDLTFAIDTLAAGDSVALDVTMTIGADAIGDLTNYAEISSADDDGDAGTPAPTDVDSTADGENQNTDGEDANLVDDATDGDGNNGGDEDDHDPASLTVTVFDLALIKEVSGAGPFSAGGPITFTITVYNQGNVDATDIVVTDHAPAGLSYASSNAATVTTTTNAAAVVVTDNGDLTFAIDALAAGDSVALDVTMTIGADATGDLTNYAEISSADDDGDAGTPAPTDVDSTPDGDNQNTDGEDANLVDDATDGDGKNGGDEDDHDPATFSITPPGTFDLALIKEVSSTGPFAPGDPITFTITVYNQGSIDATDVVVTDHAPAGLSYDSSNAAAVTTTTNAAAVVVTDNGDLTFAIDALAAGDSVALDVTMDIAGDATGDLTNYAEISSADDDGDAGTPAPTDVDSTPDGDNQNTDGEDANLVDDATDGDGKNGGDEDDHDPATFSITPPGTFDLALIKELSSTGPFAPGDPVTFTITVYNQGSIDATDVVVTDHAPAGLSYASSNAATVTTTTNAAAVVVTDNGDLTFAIDALAAGDSVALDVTLDIAADATGDLTNYAEISSADDDGDAGTPAPTDVDSTPDGDNQNTDGEDANLVDDATDGDGKNGGDEDDHDPATFSITPPGTFDLALIKELSSTGPFAPGDPVTFTITVYNQGDVDATDIAVTDHAPTGLSYSSSNVATVTTTTDANAVVVSDNGALTFGVDALAAGDSVAFDVTMTIAADATGDLTNYAEISSADDDGDAGTPAPTDVDSTPDGENQNTDGEAFNLADNATDGDGKNGGDEDDHDPAMLTVVAPGTFDLALVKAVSSTGPFAPGTDATFTITVYNQGSLDATDIVVTDHAPAGLSYSSSNAATVTTTTNAAAVVVTDNGDLTFAIDALAAGDSVELDVTMRIAADATGDLTNYAEISSADDDGDAGTAAPTDVDSTPDGDNQNTDGEDANLVDDATDGDGKNGGDEDDHDPATLTVTPVETFDLALMKELTSTGPFEAGDSVNFTITVFNQGNVDATNIEITDYAPDGLTLTAFASASAGVDVDLATGLGSIETLAADTQKSYELTFTIDSDFQGTSLVNWAEISSADDDDDATNTAPVDVDSTPDADNQNTAGEADGTFVDDAIDQDGKNGGDEDDHDPATVVVGQVFDLGLKKETVSTGPFTAGDNVTFSLTVENQGSLDAYRIDVVDYIPAELTYVSSNVGVVTTTTESNAVVITDNGVDADGNLTFTLDTLSAADSVVFEVTFKIDADFDGASIVNSAEIAAADDDTDTDNAAPTDVDSTPDSDNQNTDGEQDDSIVDNATNQNGKDGGDEDDHDIEEISMKQPVFDLALIKAPKAGQTIVQGGDVVFEITVINQGQLAAYSIDVTEHPPTGLAFKSINATAVTTSDDDNAVVITDNGSGAFSIDTLAVADQVTVEVTMTVADNATGDLTNYAEISAADDDEDPDNDPPTDLDSTPDTTNQNGDGENDDMVDDAVDEDGKNGGDEDDHDAGTISVVELAEIGNYVWYDNNYDGVQDSDEQGVGNVTVKLYDENDTLVATTTTGSDGSYLFEDLVPGVYYVEFDLDTLPADYSATRQNSGTDDAKDSDADPSTGRTIRTTLDSGESDTDWDFGIYQPASIGDYVWFDTDGDGIQDADENGIENVTVNLLDPSGSVVETTTTNADGFYEFTGLNPGNYIVEFVEPAGHGFTMHHEGLDAAVDSDADRTTGRTELVTLSAGQSKTDIDAGMASGAVLAAIEQEVARRIAQANPTPTPTAVPPTATPTAVPQSANPTAVPPTPVPTAVPVQNVQGVNVGLTAPTINKAVSQSIGGAGDTLVYTVNITNPNNTTMVDVRASDALSSKLDYVSGSSSQGTVSYTAGTRIVNASLGDIAAGGTVTITIRARINGFAQAPDRIDNTAQASAANLPGVTSNVVSTQLIPNQIPTTGENASAPGAYAVYAVVMALVMANLATIVIKRREEITS